MAKIKLSRVLQIAAESDARIEDIARAFKFYKETGNLGAVFGRDVDIGRPRSAKQNELMHIHLYPATLEVRGIAVQQHNRTSDIFLIYCKGVVDPNTYCLIDIIWQNAHEKLRSEQYIRDELVPVAARFREIF